MKRRNQDSKKEKSGVLKEQKGPSRFFGQFQRTNLVERLYKLLNRQRAKDCSLLTV